MPNLSHIPNSADTIRQVRETTDTILLSFSCGKDAIATWLECRKHFPRIIPYYLYPVPDLEFVERSLRYYEDFFGQRIHRLPHPSLYRMLDNCVFQPPERARMLKAADIPRFTYRDVEDALREDHQLGPEALAAVGVRAADSVMRLQAIRRNGPILRTQRKFYPIWDWKKEQLLSEIQRAGAKLPVDYRLFGRSFDGIHAQYLGPIKEHYPDDYERILHWFPLVDLELYRRKM